MDVSSLVKAGFSSGYLQMRPGGFQRRFIFFRVKLRVLAGREGPEDIYGNLERWKPNVTLATDRVKSELLINKPSCGWNALLPLAVSSFIQQERFHRPLRAQTEKNCFPPGLFKHLNGGGS